MLLCTRLTLVVGFILGAVEIGHAQQTVTQPSAVPAQSTSKQAESWGQWRGPRRDGTLKNVQLPDSLSEDVLKKSWATKLDASYSGALIVKDRVFVTESKNGEEVVTALDRKNGSVVWTHQWKGSMKVPFFAAANGSWIRSTPSYSDGKLYVAGMQDVLYCLDATNGQEVWSIDFPKKLGTSKPNFGFVCSPLVDSGFVYVQAGGGFTKLDKNTGDIVWQSLKDGGGMNGSAFSSPVIATIQGKRQAVVQTRSQLCGVELEKGQVLWQIDVPTFRGMNILTPTIVGNSVFTSTYGGTTQLVDIQSSGTGLTAQTKWKKPAEGYMSSPVIVGDYAYVHLKNTRFACFDLKTGEEKWRSGTFGKYASMVAAGDKILALDQRGELLMFKASPGSFDLLDRRSVGDDSWAHVAVADHQIAVRNLKEVVLFEWPAK